jgi:uroporphyrinogen decarboxylase
MKACRREPVPYTPIWLMRQAGRYMKEYRELREKTPFLKLCKSPQLAAEVTVYAAERIKADAAIIFSDLLLTVEPMGLKLSYGKSEGPTINPPVREAAAIDALKEVEGDELGYVYEAIRRTRAELADATPLIGFCGAPFTVASYMVEGKASRNYLHTKSLMLGDPGAWNALMERIVRAQTVLLNRQILAGAQAVQVFDSWAGCLSPEEYRRHVQPHTAALIGGVTPGVPVIHFSTGTAGYLPDVRNAGGYVIGVDWRVDLDRAWEQVGEDVGIMGNLDPTLLFGTPERLRTEAERILKQAAGRHGHVFNLGHGVLPETPVDNVIRLVEMVHEISAR